MQLTITGSIRGIEINAYVKGIVNVMVNVDTGSNAIFPFSIDDARSLHVGDRFHAAVTVGAVVDVRADRHAIPA